MWRGRWALGLYTAVTGKVKPIRERNGQITGD